MDKARLSSLVYKRTGIGLDPQDPAFAIVELNRAVFEEVLDEALDRIGKQLDALPERIRSSGSAVVTEAACQAMEQILEALRQARRLIAFDTEQAQRRVEQIATARHAVHVSKPAFGPVRRLIPYAALVLALCAGGFVLGALIPLLHAAGL
jgi:hypothetical protein